MNPVTLPIRAERAGRAPRIGVLYPSGAGNLGDEAILQATFAAVRAQWPNVDLHAFTLHPARTAANHGVQATALTGVNRRLFAVPRDDAPFLVRAGWGFARRTRAVPLVGRATRFLADCNAAVVLETMALRNAREWLRTADLLLAAGGGQLDAVWGGTWGQPYALARWAWLASRAGVPFAFLSVGYGGAPSRLSRRLLRYAVSRAAYCSVRDSGSRSLTKELGVKSELPIVPDLAFALEPEPAQRPRRPGYDIGIGPMIYMRPGSWPNEDLGEYRRFVALWADIVSERVSRGDRVHLFATDPADMDAVRDVWAALGDDVRECCSIAHAGSPNALLGLFRRLDMVIASRLHGVLLAIVAGRPVIGLSHERKVRAVMTDAGVAEFCTDLKTAGLAQVSELVDTLAARLTSCARELGGYSARARSAVRKQEELLPQLLRRR